MLTKPISGTNYTVQHEETLFSIAEEAYGNGNFWGKIYNANRVVIGNSPELLKPGTVIIIP